MPKNNNHISSAQYRKLADGLPKKRRRALEAPIQRAFFKLAQLKLEPWQYDLLFAIPNGGRRDARTAALMKAEGVKAGVWDIFLAIPIQITCNIWQHGLWLECKAKTSRSKAQKEFERNFHLQGYAGAVFHSAEEGVRIIEDYLAGKPV